MKKILSVISLILFASVIFGAVSYKKGDNTQVYNLGADYSDNQIISANGDSCLLDYTTAVFTISAGKYTADTSSVSYKVFNSSIGVIFSSVGASGASAEQMRFVFDLTATANDTILEVISSQTAQSLLYVTDLHNVPQSTISTMTAPSLIAGYGEGLYCGGSTSGKDYGEILGTTITIYLNGTIANSKYFNKNLGKHYFTQVECATATTAGISYQFYEGGSSTSTPTKISIPYYNEYTQTWSDFAPIVGTRNNAVEFRVTYSTYPGSGSFEIHKGIK